MRVRFVLAFATLASSAPGLVGCGPSLSTLIEEKRYVAAMCDAVGASEKERGPVADLLLNDAELRLDVRPVSDEAMRAAVEPALKAVRFDVGYQQRAADLSGRYALLETRVTRRKLPVNSERMTVRPRGGSFLGTPIMGQLTGEALPPQRTVCGAASLSWLGRGKMGAGACALTDEATDTFRGSAPLAAALADAFASKQGCTGRSSEDCLHYLVVDTHAHGTAALHVELEWSSDGVSCRFVKRTAAFIVRLGDAATVRADVTKRFARGARAMNEVDVEYQSGAWTTR